MAEVVTSSGVEAGRTTTDRSGRLIVLYDGRCPLCTFQTRTLSWLDWFGVTAMVPFDHPEAEPYTQGLDPADLSAAIHVVTRRGRIIRGARALRHIALRIPVLAPLALVLWLPGVIWVAELLYAMVSRHRLSLSRVFGCQGACQVLPARHREEDVVADRAPEQG